MNIREAQEFGAWLKEIRGTRSQTEIARLVKTSQGAISRLENGDTSLSPTMARRIARALGVSQDEAMIAAGLLKLDGLDMNGLRLLREIATLSDSDRELVIDFVRLLRHRQSGRQSNQQSGSSPELPSLPDAEKQHNVPE